MLKLSFCAHVYTYCIIQSVPSPLLRLRDSRLCLSNLKWKVSEILILIFFLNKTPIMSEATFWVEDVSGLGTSFNQKRFITADIPTPVWAPSRFILRNKNFRRLQTEASLIMLRTNSSGTSLLLLFKLRDKRTLTSRFASFCLKRLSLEKEAGCISSG
jgi:hypothetical protein